MLGKVERALSAAVKRCGTICVALIDSEGIAPSQAASVAKRAVSCGVEAVLVGGSTAVDQLELHRIVMDVKRVTTRPVILFPGNITGVSPDADAILFSSLLNSDNPYFITEAQALGALAVKKYHLEAIPMAYLIVGEGGATGFVGRARGIPQDKPNLVVMYALAAQYLGMRFLYLEAGSGVTSQVPPRIVAHVRKAYNGTLIVGGGIKDPSHASPLARAGADILVIGTLLETKRFETSLTRIIRSVTQEKNHRI